MAIKKLNTNGKDTFEVYLNLRGPNGRLQKRVRGFSSMRAASEAEFKIKAEFLDERNAPRVYVNSSNLSIRLCVVLSYSYATLTLL